MFMLNLLSMIDVSDQQFEKMIGEAMDAIPEQYAKAMKNVGITWDEQPNMVQREKLRLRGDQQLFGLYEGIPLTKRNSGYNLVLPDKITIFKHPMIDICFNLAELRAQIGKTLWHEVAHHFGLNHSQIDALQHH
ncbi:MAG: metallopeptidase family protein [Candidatus Saccharimonadales bacterium]